MRYAACFIVLMLLLAACSGAAPEPTATTAPMAAEPTEATETAEAPEQPVGDGDNDSAESLPTSAPEDPTIAAAQETLNAVIVPTLPPPGTLAVASSGTEEVMSAPFDSIIFTQTGGQEGLNLVIELRGDGTLIRDGVESQVNAETVTAINAMLNELNFFNVQGQFTGPSTSQDAYQYSIEVNSAEGSRTIFAQDGLVPPELLQLFSAMVALGTE